MNMCVYIYFSPTISCCVPSHNYSTPYLLLLYNHYDEEPTIKQKLKQSNAFWASLALTVIFFYSIFFSATPSHESYLLYRITSNYFPALMSICALKLLPSIHSLCCIQYTLPPLSHENTLFSASTSSPFYLTIPAERDTVVNTLLSSNTTLQLLPAAAEKSLHYRYKTLSFSFPVSYLKFI